MTNFVTAVKGLTVRGSRRKLPQNFDEKAARIRKALMRDVPLSIRSKMRTELQVHDVVEFGVKEKLNSLQSADFCSGDWAPWSKMLGK